MEIELLPVKNEQGILDKFTLKSIGINTQVKNKNNQRTGWVTLEVPSNRVLYVTEETTSEQENTITFADITNIVKELLESVEAGLVEESW